jgi:hypothetical protein
MLVFAIVPLQNRLGGLAETLSVAQEAKLLCAQSQEHFSISF